MQHKCLYSLCTVKLEDNLSMELVEVSITLLGVANLNLIFFLSQHNHGITNRDSDDGDCVDINPSNGTLMYNQKMRMEIEGIEELKRNLQKGVRFLLNWKNSLWVGNTDSLCRIFSIY